MAIDLYGEGRRFSAYVGAEVRAEAGRQKMSVAALARAMSMDRSTLIRYLDGVRAFPVATLYVAAEVLDQDPGYIVAQAYNRFLLENPDIDHRSREADQEAEIVEFARANTPPGGLPTAEDSSRAALDPGYGHDAETT